MSGTIAWFGNNPVAANLVMVVIIVSGLVASTSIRAEIFAEIALDRISIIAEAVRRKSLDLPGGSVRTDGGANQRRTTAQACGGAEYEGLVLWTRPDGSRLRVGDVATVVDGFAETNQQARFDRRPTVLLSVSRAGDRSVLDIATAATPYVERARGGRPRVWR